MYIPNPLPPHRYLKLMMRRIDWSTAPATAPPPGGSRDANGDAAMEDEDEDAPPNVCTLVSHSKGLCVRP